MVKRSYYTAFQHPVVAHNVYRKCPCRPAGSAQESADSGVHKICDVAKPQTLADVLVKRVLGTLKKEVANRISSACYNERENALSMQRCNLQVKLSYQLHITKLRLAYARFLDETWSKRELAGDMVWKLAGDMVWKLNGISEKTADEGIQIIHKMLEHLWVEYMWGRIVKILECAMDYAGVQKARACRQVKMWEDKLIKLGTRCVGSHHTSAVSDRQGRLGKCRLIKRSYVLRNALQPWFASCLIKDRIRFCTLGDGRHLNFKKDLTRI